MKRFIKLLIPAVIIAIAVTLLVLPVAAAGDTTTYAVWNSEEDYLANPDSPRATFTDKHFTTVAFQNRGYIKCYGDIEITEQVTLNEGQFVTIDLNGYKLTTKHKIMVNGTSSGTWNQRGGLTIKDGTIVHESSQFIQPRPNSEIYFVNCNITENTGSNLIYESSSRIIAFTDCTLTFNSVPSNGSGSINLAAAYSGTAGDRLNKGEDGKQLDYVRNLLFDNTVVIDNCGRSPIVNIQGSEQDYINICFTNGASFNTLGDNFIECKNNNAQVDLYIARGVKFPTKEIPFVATMFEYTLLDSIVRVDNKVILGNPESILTEGMEQNPEDPKLIWGNSYDQERPYQLCYYTCDVEWFDSPDSEGVKLTGVAEGAILERDAIARGYYLNTEDNRFYNDVHIGWSSDPESLEGTKRVVITDVETKLYAIYRNDQLSVVCFKNDKKLESDIISGVTGNVLTNSALASFKDGSYVYVYDDITFGADEPMSINNSFVLDLGGHTLYKDLVSSPDSALIDVTRGVELTVKNGVITSSLTGVARINGWLILNGVDVRFDRSTAFLLENGLLKLENSTLTQMTYDTDVPAVMLGNIDSSDFILEKTVVDVKGALVASTKEQSAPVSISLLDCDNVCADSIYYVHKNIADELTYQKLTITLRDVNVSAREVFDVATSKNGEYLGNIEYVMSGTCMFSSKPNTESGKLTLGNGLSIIGISGEKFNYTIGQNPIEVKFNAELRSGFTLNFYVPTSMPVTEVTTFLSTTAKDDLPIEKIEGIDYYVVKVNGISAANSLDSTIIKVGFTAEDKNYFAEFKYGMLDYFGDLISSTDPLMRKLCAAAMRYVQSAYAYAGSTLPAEFIELLNSVEYKDALRAYSEVSALKDGTSLGNLPTAFTGAQLYLSSEVKVRFNLKSDFTGTLNVNGEEYSVTEGKVGELSYIDAKLSTLDLYRVAVNISGTYAGGEISGSYSLSDYIRSQTGNNALSDMLAALYALSYEAFVYDNGGVLPPYIDHIPPVDVELQ